MAVSFEVLDAVPGFSVPVHRAVTAASRRSTKASGSNRSSPDMGGGSRPAYALLL